MPLPTENLFAGKKILIVHFRVGRTDGVSIEIAAWKEILESAGAAVKLCSGPVNHGADFVISNLEQQLNPSIFELDEAAFGKAARLKTEQDFVEALKREREIIVKEFSAILDQYRPDHIIISNIFSVGEHIAAAGAFARVLDEKKIPTIGVHHDFYWEGNRYKNPAFPAVEKELEEYFPPISPWLTHCCINSIAKEELKKRKGVDAAIVYDTIDFDQPLFGSDRSRELRHGCSPDDNDIIVLQATRIVRRKNIEIAVDLVKRLADRIEKADPTKLYDGRLFNPAKNKVVLVLAGYPEKRDEKYKDNIFEYAKQLGVNLCYLGNLINDPAGEKRYSLLDSYPIADIITYPSEYEGFGNQFLEAVLAKKPVVVFEYPVFKIDIAPKGFGYISLGDVIESREVLVKVPEDALERAAKQAWEILTNKERYLQLVEKNFELGKKHFSYENTFLVLTKLLSRQSGLSMTNIRGIEKRIRRGKKRL